ncbi:TPA: hypothetical protein R8F97_005769 [Pseudomonas putida]|nr:hypothetical protein [Pseudomonas putida]
MSAYILNRFHISAILMFSCTGKPDATTYQTLADQGQQLLDENIRSVRTRYPGETFKAELFGLDETVRKPTRSKPSSSSSAWNISPIKTPTITRPRPFARCMKFAAKPSPSCRGGIRRVGIWCDGG